MGGSYNDLGTSYETAGDWDEALACFRKAIDIAALLVTKHPGVVAHRALLFTSKENLAEVYREMGQLDRAIAVWDDEMRREPDNARILWQIGTCQLEKGDLPQAVVAYSKCIELPDELKPRSLRSGAVHRRGEVYMLLGQDDKALRDFERALELDPDDCWACGCFAQFLALCADPAYRDPDRAVELARKAVGLRPNRAELWRTLGAAQFRQGDLDAALVSLEKTEEFGWWAPFLQAMVHHRRGNTDQARKCFELGEQRLAEDHSGWSELTRRLRDEAAELLGITETPSGKPEEEEKPDQRSADDSGTTGQEASEAAKRDKHEPVM